MVGYHGNKITYGIQSQNIGKAYLITYDWVRQLGPRRSTLWCHSIVRTGSTKMHSAIQAPRRPLRYTRHDAKNGWKSIYAACRRKPHVHGRAGKPSTLPCATTRLIPWTGWPPISCRLVPRDTSRPCWRFD